MSRKRKPIALADAQARADAWNKSLVASRFPTYGFVRIRTVGHDFDATIRCAFARTIGDFYVIFAEHHPPKLIHKDEIELIYEYRITKHQDDIPELADGR